jgi:hypothetical protein
MRAFAEVKAMEAIEHAIAGDMFLDHDVRLYGIVTGSVTVPDGMHLDLEGLVGHDLIVLEGGEAVVDGVVVGDLINRGGSVVVHGAVEGHIVDQGGEIELDQAAIVGKGT